MTSEDLATLRLLLARYEEELRATRPRALAERVADMRHLIANERPT